MPNRLKTAITAGLIAAKKLGNSVVLAAVAILSSALIPAQATGRLPPATSVGMLEEAGCCTTASADVDCFCDGKWHLNKCDKACLGTVVE